MTNVLVHPWHFNGGGACLNVLIRVRHRSTQRDNKPTHLSFRPLPKFSCFAFSHVLRDPGGLKFF